jgi:hypothetical protein
MRAPCATQDLATLREVTQYRTPYQSGVRDVQYNPVQHTRFASAHEQSTIEVRTRVRVCVS